MRNIYVPTSGPGDWKCLLADPEKHWVRGRSARTLAHFGVQAKTVRLAKVSAKGGIPLFLAGVHGDEGCLEA